MRVRRVRVETLREGTIRLRGAEAHHLARVLRVRPGDPVEAFDGAGSEALGVVAAVEEDGVALTLEAPRASTLEAPIRVTLAVALLKGDKLAQVVRQGTELGVARFAPVATRRADVPRLSPAKADRLRRVAREAAKQSGRARVPDVADPVPLAHLSSDGPVWLADPRGEVALADACDALTATDEEALTIVTGPEGGFAPDEVEAALDRGARAVRVGPRVLRAETAPIAVAAALLARVER